MILSTSNIIDYSIWVLIFIFKSNVKIRPCIFAQLYRRRSWFWQTWKYLRLLSQKNQFFGPIRFSEGGGGEDFSLYSLMHNFKLLSASPNLKDLDLNKVEWTLPDDDSQKAQRYGKSEFKKISKKLYVESWAQLWLIFIQSPVIIFLPHLNLYYMRFFWKISTNFKAFLIYPFKRIRWLFIFTNLSYLNQGCFGALLVKIGPLVLGKRPKMSKSWESGNLTWCFSSGEFLKKSPTID